MGAFNPSEEEVASVRNVFIRFFIFYHYNTNRKRIERESAPRIQSQSITAFDYNATAPTEAIEHPRHGEIDFFLLNKVNAATSTYYCIWFH